jgi:multidrug efflux pump subunit AcrA (membrane-fusion protein)
MKKKNLGLLAGVVVIAGAAAWYFNQNSGAHAEGGATGKGGRGGPQGPTVVNVVAPVRQDVGVELSANGTVTPLRTVDLHPQTTSTIRQVHIQEGQFVKAGQLMFTLDDRADRANVDRAQGQVARDNATLADLERQYKRSQELFAQKFIAQSAVDSLHHQRLSGQPGAAVDIADHDHPA